jgi:hypothetical protein
VTKVPVEDLGAVTRPAAMPADAKRAAREAIARSDLAPGRRAVRATCASAHPA